MTLHLSDWRPRQGGFTLVELMVTVALLAVILTLGVPSFTDLLRSWQRDVATRAFTGHVRMARSEAIKTSQQVVMCTSADGAGCAGDNNWMAGWIVFTDRDGDRTVDAADDTILATQGPLSGLVRMQTNNNVNNFFFLPSGLMPTRQSTLRIEAQGSESVEQNAVAISSTGRISVSKEPKGTP